MQKYDITWIPTFIFKWLATNFNFKSVGFKESFHLVFLLHYLVYVIMYVRWVVEKLKRGYKENFCLHNACVWREVCELAGHWAYKKWTWFQKIQSESEPSKPRSPIAEVQNYINLFEECKMQFLKIKDRKLYTGNLMNTCSIDKISCKLQWGQTFFDRDAHRSGHTNYFVGLFFSFKV